MTLRLSKRISIKWGDDHASEPTDTVVLSVGSYYMDLRIKLADRSTEWAFAGTREILVQSPVHCRWYHTIDSRQVFEPDEGKFQPLPNGDDLETGEMACPDRKGQVTPYEEVWRQLHPKAGKEYGWILEHKTEDGTRFIGQYGGIYYAMQQDRDGKFSVRKEEYVESDGLSRWKTTFKSGPAGMPSLEALGAAAFPEEDQWKVGSMATVNSETYHVRAWHRSRESHL